MSTVNEQKLAAAWKRVDDRNTALQVRHHKAGDIPLYEIYAMGPATDNELKQLEIAIISAIPFELAYSLRRWNGRWIAPDHEIDLAPVLDHLRMAQVASSPQQYDGRKYERVLGPINPVLESTKRYLFGSHQLFNSNLYLDYEDPPEGGCLGQVIRIGEEPVAQYVAASFVDFLNLIADAPVYDDDPDFDPLAWRP